MKIKNLIAVAALLLGSTSASAQLASGGFKLNNLGAGNVEIYGFADDYTFASDGVVEIPATLPNTGGAAFKVIGIADYAFSTLSDELRLKVKSLKINASVTYIGTNAFRNLGNLASVEFGTSSEKSKLKAIRNAAFAENPMLKSISFANCPALLYFTLNGEATTTGDVYNTTLPGALPNNNTYVLLATDDIAGVNAACGTALAAGEVLSTANANTYNATLYGAIDPAATDTYANPFVWINDNGTPLNPADDFVEANEALTTITLNEGTLDFGTALANLTNLATQNIKDTRIILLAAGALAGDTKITTLELPETKVYKMSDGTLDYTKAPKLQANALAGSQITTLIVNGNITTGYLNTVESLGVPATTGLSAVNTLTTVTFKGDIGSGGIKASAFQGNTKLATVNFEGKLDDGAVLGTAFKLAGSGITPAAGSYIQLTVNALKAVDGAFAQTAFADAAGTPDQEKVLVKVPLTFTVPPATSVHEVKWDQAAPAPKKIYLESNDNTTFYAKLNTSANVSISKGKGDVVVYEAYADGSDIYMDPLYSIEDKYVVAGDAGHAVIVKVKGTSTLIKTDDDGKYIECEAGGATTTQRYLLGNVLANQLQYQVEKPRAFDPRGQATVTPRGKI